MRGTTELYLLDLFVYRNSKHRKRANYRYKSGLQPSQSPDKSIRLLFGLQEDTITAKVLCIEMVARQTAEAVWELSECFNNFT